MEPATDTIDTLLPDAAKEELLALVPEIALAPARNDAVKQQVLQRVRASRAAHHTVRADEGDWQSMGPLVDRRILADDGVTRTFLMRLQPGARRPAHSHAADEASYVLEGTVRYGAIELRAGDFHVAPPGSVHEGVATDTGALVLIRSFVRPAPAPK